MSLQKPPEKLEGQALKGTKESDRFEETMAAYHYVKSSNESFLRVTNTRCVEAVRKLLATEFQTEPQKTKA